MPDRIVRVDTTHQDETRVVFESGAYARITTATGDVKVFGRSGNLISSYNMLDGPSVHNSLNGNVTGSVAQIGNNYVGNVDMRS